jgi:hypothetical protein
MDIKGASDQKGKNDPMLLNKSKANLKQLDIKHIE